MPKEMQRVHFRLLNMDCCHVLLCWVNPRLPMYCPECGKFCYPAVKGWITDMNDDNAILTYTIQEPKPVGHDGEQ
jgi:hypothetical protein